VSHLHWHRGEAYNDDLYDAKCDLTFLHVYDVYGNYGSEFRV
jgi:hypothetical protein